MTPHREEIVLLPAGRDPNGMEDYRRRLERLQERQEAARARNIETQRRFRLLTGVVIGALLSAAATSAFVAYSLARLRQTVATQLESANKVVAVSNERWKQMRQALIDNRSALESSQQLVARFRAETRVRPLLGFVDTYLERLRNRGSIPSDDSVPLNTISASLKGMVRAALLDELTRNPDAGDAQLIAEIERVVDGRVSSVIERSRAQQ